MAEKREINVKRFLKRVKDNVTNTLYGYELETQEGLMLTDALVPFGEPIDDGEEELDAIIEEILLQVEISLRKPTRTKRKTK